MAERPRIGLALVAVLLVFGYAGFRKGPPRGTFRTGQDWLAADQAHADFDLGRDSVLIAVFGDVLNPGAESDLRELERRVESLVWVEALFTPWDIPGARGKTLLQLQENSFAAGTCLDDGGRGMFCYMRFTDVKQASEWPGDDWASVLEGVARGAFVEGGHGLEVGVTGEGRVFSAQGESFRAERFRFMAVGAFFGFLIASIAFRSVRATLLAGLPPLLGVATSVGIARLLGLGSEGFASIVLPLLVLTIGFTDSLHVVVYAVRARAGGAVDGAAAAAEAVRELGWPCALTSLTTAIGFASLATSGSKLVVDFGLSCALGTAVSFVCVIVSIPLLARTPLGRNLESVRPPNLEGNAESLGPVARWLDRVLRATLRVPRTTAILATAATVGLVFVAVQLKADRFALSDLAEGSHAAQTLRRVDAELGGVFPINVRIDWAEDVELSAAIDAARQAADLLRAEPLVSGVHGPAELTDALPLGRFALAALPAELKRPWIDLDHRRGLVHARVPDAGSAALVPAFQTLRAGLAAIDCPGVTVRLVGLRVAYLDAVTEITHGLRRSLGLAAVLILITLALAFKSWKLGLASVVPNLLPLGAAAGALTLKGGFVDVSTLTALTLSLGIATDDTIHVLARWRTERERGAPPRIAARAAVLHTLPALMLTTLTLSLAFGQLLTSSLPMIRDFGLLASTTLVAAFFADVWLLPALLVALTGERPSRKP